MFSIKSQKCQEPPRTDKSQTPTNADLQSTYYSTLSTKLDTPRRTLPTIRGRRCSRRMAHWDKMRCIKNVHSRDSDSRTLWTFGQSDTLDIGTVERSGHLDIRTLWIFGRRFKGHDVRAARSVTRDRGALVQMSGVFQMSRVPKCQNAKMSKCQNVKMSKCQNAKMSKCQDVKMPKCQNAKMSKCQNAMM